LKIDLRGDFFAQNGKSQIADFSSWLNGVVARFNKKASDLVLKSGVKIRHTGFLT